MMFIEDFNLSFINWNNSFYEDKNKTSYYGLFIANLIEIFFHSMFLNQQE